MVNPNHIFKKIPTNQPGCRGALSPLKEKNFLDEGRELWERGCH